MLTVRPSAERGHANHGWLDTNYTFSFSNYVDPRYMGFRALRVINEDVIAPGMGFGTHPHNDMEIITYVLSGAVAHRDSTSSGGELRPGEVQHMSAGTGIRHSEFNPSEKESLHLLQIWLLPKRRGIKPAYNQRAFPIAEQRNQLHLVASEDGRDGSIQMETDADLYAARLEKGASVTHRPTRPHGWLQIARGEVTANGQPLKRGDGLAFSEEKEIVIKAGDKGAEFLLFDLD